MFINYFSSKILMPNAPINLNDRLIETEHVLKGLPLMNLGAPYYKNSKEISRSTYLLQIKQFQREMYGLFVNKNKFFETKIGFVYEKEGIQNKTYYEIKSNGELNPCPRTRDIIYLPLKNTNLQGDTLFNVLGIEGSEGIFPLMYLFKINSETLYADLFENSEGKVGSAFFLGNSQINTKIQEIFKKATKEKTDGAKSENAKIVKERNSKPSKIEAISGDIDWRKPQSIIKYLDDYVIGQQKAKEKIAVAFSSYMMKVLHPELQIEKSNILFLGATGSGKTLMAKTLAERAGIPLVATEISTKTGEGYKDQSLSSSFKEMREKTEGEFPAGIMLIDEIDKISSGRINTFSDSLQNNLVAWADDRGSTINFDDYASRSKNIPSLNTKNILFIGAGAFAEDKDDNTLEKIIEERLNGGKFSMGIGAKLKTIEKEKGLIHKVKAEDIVKYGLKPELVGRFPIQATFDELTMNDKIKILTQSKDSILISYHNIFDVKELDIELDEEIPRIIAESCTEKTGARELKAKCQELFEPILLQPNKFVNNHKKIKITPELAEKILYKN